MGVPPCRADGRRANRTGSTEIATLVERNTSLASVSFHDEGREIVAIRTLLKTVDVSGRVITLNALHTTRNTASIIVETPDYCART